MGQKIVHFNKKTLAMAVAALVLLALAGIAVFNFTTSNLQRMIFEAGSESLEETYRVVGDELAEVSNSRWNYLKQIGSYLDLAEAQGASTQTVQEAIDLESYGASDFYLVSSSGSYSTIDGKTGYIDLGDDLFSLIDDGENIIADGSLPTRENMVFYAVPVKEATFNGFSYSAVAFGYDKSAVSKLLKISAFEGRGSAYLVHANGRVAFSMGGSDLSVSNVFSLLNSAGVSDDSVEDVTAKFKERKAGTIRARINGADYYVSYQPSGTSELFIVSFVPVSAVNKSIENINGFLSAILVAIALALTAALVGAVVYLYRRAMMQKQAQIEEKELVFSLISEDMDSAYLLFRQGEQKALYVTPNVERMFGLTAEEVEADPCALNRCAVDGEDWRPGSLPELQPGETYREECALKNVVTGAQTTYAFELLRPQGTASDIMVAELSDISDEMRVRGTIEEALDMARAASQAKSQFLSNMSHDIRTPLNAIIGFTRLVERDANSPHEVRVHARKILSASQHLLNLINDVLDMSKIESGKTEIVASETNIEDVVRDCADIMRTNAQEKNIDFETVFKLSPACTVQADTVRLSRVLNNVLSNAVKYTPKGGRVRFSAERRLGQSSKVARYRFTVADNGIGMSEEFQKTIFDAFTREESSTVNLIQGTGLGMAITKSLVDLMGGSISVHSKKGEGSTFEILIDFEVANNDPTASAAIAAEAEEASLAGLNILAAEDNELNAEILCELLNMEDARVTVAPNGKEAVELFCASEPGTYDLILMDVMMPVMGGLEATRAIRGSGRPDANKIPIIAMTANAFSEDVSASLESGMNAHLAKPVDMNVLKSTVARILASTDDSENNFGGA